MYRLRLQPNQANQALMNAPENEVGDDSSNVVGSKIVKDWGTTPATQIVKANYGAYSGPAKANMGFYLVGPKPDYPAGKMLTDTDPNFNLNWLTYNPTDATTNKDQMSLQVAAAGYNLANPPPVSLVLERLANPALPPKEGAANQNDPQYNPYIAVDYVRQVRVQNGVKYDTNGAAANQVARADRTAFGRTQPFGALLWLAQNPTTQGATEPKHTFFRHNAKEDAPAMGGAPTLTPYSSTNTTQTLRIPFDVLYHPNRVPISLGDLLHVSGFKQHQLTQRFMTGTMAAPNLFRHRAHWTDEQTRLARLFDHLTLAPYNAGVAPNGRIPGKVNINTIWDPQATLASPPPIFSALCDAVAAGGPNQFNQADVIAVWNALLLSRDGNPGATPPTGPRPFLSLGTGAAPADIVTLAARGIQDTTLRSASSGAGAGDWDMNPTTGLRLLEPTNAGYLTTTTMKRFELLTKLKNHLTTRSNVFAVWVTVGFFEVKDATTLPVKLGAEMKWADGKIARYRMFSLVDRTQLQVWPTNDPTTGNPMCKLGAAVTAYNSITNPLPVPVTLVDSANAPIAANGITNPYTGRKWSPVDGAVITIDPDTYDPATGALLEETVELIGGKAVFRKSHNAGAVVISRGNPGPWTTYDPKADPVVLYAAKID